MTKFLSHRFGFLFPLPILIIGVVILIIGLVSMSESIVGGIALLLVGGFLALSSHGIEIDVLNRKYREYNNFFGLKKGEWISLNNFPHICLVSSRRGFRMHGRGNQSSSFVDEFIDVCLLSTDHRKKIRVKSFDTKDDAVNYAKELGTILNIKVTAFNPPISEKTLNRRRK